jgi:hypothetical protein
VGIARKVKEKAKRRGGYDTQEWMNEYFGGIDRWL